MTTAIDPIHIALTFDNGFWAPAYATMRSVCVSTRRKHDLVFHLCHRPLSEEHRADLLKIESEFGATLRFYDLSQTKHFQDLLGRVPKNHRLGDIPYARFVMDRFLPAEVERLIYLDCDMMVVSPIEEIWEADLNGKPVAAVRDAWGKFLAAERDLRGRGGVLDPADPYFNAGLLVIDMEHWRQEQIAEKLEVVIADGRAEKLGVSQNVLNLILRDNWQPLDPMWNVTGPKPEHERMGAHLLHYTGYAKPWKLYARVAFFRLYRHVMTNELFYRFWRYRMRERLAKYIPFLGAR